MVWGIGIANTNSDRNVVAGNYVGLTSAGNAVLGNGLDGIQVTSGPKNTRIGTNADGVNDAAERNVISGNARRGVWLVNAGTDQNIVAGNYIGTDITGTIDLGNADDGVQVAGSPKNNIIGGTSPGAQS